MKKLLLSAICLSAAICTMAQNTYPVDRSKYKDYSPIFAPDASLMKHVTLPISTNKAATRATSKPKLPAYVNNANAKWFPPIFNQTGGSCGVSSRVGYMMTYEWNAFRLSDASKTENRLPPHFQYPFSYNGLGKEQMAMYVGYPTGDVYGGWDISSIYGAYETNANDAGWMQGYESWHNAMFNRITSSANFPKGSNTPEGMEAIKRWLFNHNDDPSWPTVTDENGTHIVGGIAGLGCGISGSNTALIADVEANRKAGVVGKHYMEHWRIDAADHAITLVGYDDRVVFDLDKNGKYGEPKNRLGQDERGAWIFANSWGGWADNGLCYVPYPMAGGVTSSSSGVHKLTNEDGSVVTAYTGGGWWPEVYYLRQNYIPQHTMKVTMQYSKRSEISVKVGVSQNISASSPEKESVFRYINYTGDGDGNNTDAETPLLGRWADGNMHYEPMEFGIDLTDLCKDIDFSHPVKFFLIINTKGSANGKGVIKQVSVIDYSMNKNGIEFPISTQDTNIKNGGQTTVVSGIAQIEGVNAPYNLTLDDTQMLTWSAPLKGFAQPTQYIIYNNGKKVGETTATQYKPTSTEGCFTVKALYKVDGKEMTSASSNLAAKPLATANLFDKNVLKFTSSGGFIIPNVTSQAHNQFTIEYWLKPNTIRDWNQKVGQGWGTFWLHTNNNKKLTFGWNTQNGDRTDTDKPILEANKWVHIALVINGHTMTMYANGNEVGNFTSPFHSGMPAIQDGLLFGARNNDGINGCIDEVRIWDVARTQQEIKDNYQTPISNPGVEKGLLAYLKMNTISRDGKTLLYDAAGGNHAEILNNGSYSLTENESENLKKTKLPAPKLILPDKINKGEMVTLTAKTSVGTIKRQWTFTGATPSSTSANDASVVFNKVGKQTVTLTLTDAEGNTVKTTQSVNIIDVKPTADFTIANAHAKASDCVSFLALNKMAGCTYEWNISGADVQKSIHRNVSATFASSGSHRITLTVTTPDGKKLSSYKDIYIEATAPKARYICSAEDNVVIKGNKVTLQDASKYEPTEWNWALISYNKIFSGVGKTYTLQPNRAGVYKLSFTVSNAQGSNNLTKKYALIVCNADAQHGLNFSMVNGSQYKTFTTGKLKGIDSQWTIDYWLKPTYSSANTNGIYLLNDAGKEVGCLMAQAKGNAMLQVGMKQYPITTSYYIPGQWHHYAIVYNNNEFNLYRDGNKCTTIKIDYDAHLHSIDKVRIGGEAQADGTFDELRVWGKPLSQNELRVCCVAPLEGNQLTNAQNKMALKCYYQFNKVETGTTVTDTSLNNCTGTRENFGPGGDAWVSSKGVFAIDFSAPEGEKINNLDKLDRSAYRVINISDEETKGEGSKNGFAELMLDASDETYYHSQWQNGEKGYAHRLVIAKANNDVVKAITITAKRESKYRTTCISVEQSDDLHSWQMVDNNHYLFDMNVASINLLKPVTKRYIRISFNESAAQSNLLAINNLELYGTKGNDATLEQPVKLQFVDSSDQKNDTNNKASNAVDGKENTQWMSKEGTPYPHTLEVKNTNNKRCIERLQLIQSKIGNADETRKNNVGRIIIFVSKDGKTWNEHETIRVPFYQKSMIRLCTPIYAPYIRFQFTESQWKGSSSLAIKEIKAFGRLANETGIEEILQNNMGANAPIYNLQGLCVGFNMDNLPAGIYIINGKKFVKQ